MPVAAARDLLAAAERGGFALPAFNVSASGMALGVLDAAAERRAAVLLQLTAANAEAMGGLEPAAAHLLALAHGAATPVGIHLDHGADLHSLRRALAAGCTSVMFDGSTLPYGENVRETRRARVVADASGVALEAELGHVGGDEPGVVTSESELTDPLRAADFVSATGVDALAVSVGTAHGRSGAVEIPLLLEIRRRTGELPLVLHGGSGVAPEALSAAIAAGVRKVNISREIHRAFAGALAEALAEAPRAGREDPRPAMAAARSAVAAVAGLRIEALGATASAR